MSRNGDVEAVQDEVEDELVEEEEADEIQIAAATSDCYDDDDDNIEAALSRKDLIELQKKSYAMLMEMM